MDRSVQLWCCDMANRITSQETRVWLEDHFRRQRNLGLWKAVANIALLPADPFKPESRRLPRPAFLFAAGLLVVAAGWFFYFNFVWRHG